MKTSAIFISIPLTVHAVSIKIDILLVSLLKYLYFWTKRNHQSNKTFEADAFISLTLTATL